MAALSIEMNRLLGSALLDPILQGRIFSEGRADVLKGFSLSPHEYTVVMDSTARTLSDLASDVCSRVNGTNGKHTPVWMSSTGEVDTRTFRRQANSDPTLAVTPTLQRLFNDLAVQLADVETEFKQGYHVA